MVNDAEHFRVLAGHLCIFGELTVGTRAGLGFLQGH